MKGAVAMANKKDIAVKKLNEWIDSIDWSNSKTYAHVNKAGEFNEDGDDYRYGDVCIRVPVNVSKAIRSCEEFAENAYDANYAETGALYLRVDVNKNFSKKAKLEIVTKDDFIQRFNEFMTDDADTGELNIEYDEDTFDAADFSNEELIELLKDLECSQSEILYPFLDGYSFGHFEENYFDGVINMCADFDTFMDTINDPKGIYYFTGYDIESEEYGFGGIVTDFDDDMDIISGCEYYDMDEAIALPEDAVKAIVESNFEKPDVSEVACRLKSNDDDYGDDVDDYADYDNF